MSYLYNRLRELCERNKITGYKMSKDCGVSVNLMTELKSGRRDGVSAETAQKLASYFGVSVAYLLGKEENPATEDGDGEDENIIIMTRAAKRMTPEERQRMVDAMKVLFKDAFD